MPGAWTPESHQKFMARMAAKKGCVLVRRTVDRAVELVVHDAVSVAREPLDFSALDVVIDRTRQHSIRLPRSRNNKNSPT